MLQSVQQTVIAGTISVKMLFKDEHLFCLPGRRLGDIHIRIKELPSKMHQTLTNRLESGRRKKLHIENRASRACLVLWEAGFGLSMP